jgi:hypothetical protein
MDDDFGRDDLDAFVDRLGSLIRSTEVMSVYFVAVAQSLIIDFRRTDVIGPRVMTDRAVATHHDRFLSFGRLRPSLPLPEQLSLAPWHYSVRLFEECGLLAQLRERSLADTGLSLLHEVDDSYLFLLRLERQYLRDMVRGVGMRTLWERDRR